LSSRTEGVKETGVGVAQRPVTAGSQWTPAD
jgi:hypothetical protein